MLFALRNCQASQFPLAVELEIEMSLLALEQVFILNLVGSRGSRRMLLFFLHLYNLYEAAYNWK